MNAPITTALIAGALTAAAAGAGTPLLALPKEERLTQEAAFHQALDLLKSGRHAAAYGRFSALADSGHVPSARWAMAMLHHGAALYGSEWSASPGQQARWNALIVNHGRQFNPTVGIAAGE